MIFGWIYGKIKNNLEIIVFEVLKMNQKRIIIQVFAFTLVFCLFASLSVFASNGKQQKEGIFTYVVEDGSAIITNVDDTEEIVSVPETLGGAPVTALAGGACGGSIKMKEIILPDSVTSIGSMCFSYCTELSRITLPKKLTTLESGIFNHCTRLRNIEIPKSVKYIEKDAFYRCDELWTITLQDGTKSIGENAFAACPNLSAATIPESVSYIGDNAFQNGAGFRIYAKPGTKAEAFAKANNIPFEELITVSVNGEKISFDQPPLTDTVNYRTLVPMRAVLSNLGAEISWDNSVNAAGISLLNNRILVRIGEPFMMVNGAPYLLSSPAIEFNNRTLLPIRSVIEAINGTVQWNEETKHIDITVAID